MARRRHQRDTGANHAPSQRQLRVGELIRHALADMLTRGEVHDPVIEGRLITVPEVRMSPDLKHATCSPTPEAVTESALARAEMGLRPGGFGMLIARQVADELVYNERRNEVLLIKHLD